MNYNRKIGVTCLLTLTLTALLLGSQAVTSDPAISAAFKIDQEIGKTSVKVESPDGRGGGSGTVIRQTDTEAHILTAAHVVDDLKIVKVTYLDGMTGKKLTVEGRVIRTDPGRDLALVVTKPVWFRSAALVTWEQYDSHVTIYQPILISGYPMLVQSPHISIGFLCDLQDRKKMRTSAHAIYGNSGGGVFMLIDGKYRLIGVLVSVLTLDGQGVHPLPMISFAVFTLDVLSFVDQVLGPR